MAKHRYWGFHLLLDMSGLNNNMRDRETLKDFLKALVKKIDMIAVGPPVIRYLLADQPNAGYSCMQLIETSSITFHLVEPSKQAYLDVFSCKEFKPEDAIEVVKEYFEPKKMRKKFLIRDAGLA